jgi:hypothetical protein
MASKPRTPSLRALNRATLARQMLLARERVPVPRAIERLVALQAQWPRPPFVGLWTRVEGFRREDLGRLLHARRVVRATGLRGTLHLMTARDYLAMRAALQPALAIGARSALRTRAAGIEVARLAEFGRSFFGERPRPFEAFRDALAERHPGGDVRAMAYLVRMHLPLVQVPTQTAWGYPASADFAPAETWLGRRLGADADPEPLALRYLAAFGPATAGDLQTWSGLPGPAARAALEALAPRLVRLRGERGRELLDLPKAPLPSEDAAAPVRLLPEFDNLLLAHSDRRRFVPDEHRRRVFLPGLRVAPTFLVDGFVAGTWSAARAKDAATLTLEPFAALARGVREPLAREAEALIRFLEPEARRWTVRLAATRR